MQNPAPMTLGNMRANGVRTLAALCWGAAAITFGFSTKAVMQTTLRCRLTTPNGDGPI
jgi:hypothetical protein